MRWPFTFLLAVAPLALPRAAYAQAAADTLPERVVARAYDAFNRRDAAAYYSFFGPVWYHSIMEDSLHAAMRRTRDEAVRGLSQLWASRGDKPTVKVIRRIVLGPYVVDEQAAIDVGVVHLDIFEVRHGKIVHEWESDNYIGWRRVPSGH